jgi:hypothetical protein
MQTATTSDEAKLAARFASGPRRAQAHVLTVDTTVRKVTLGPGGWQLYGASTQVYYATRQADATGALLGSDTAPTTSTLAAGGAGSPGTGNAWGGGIAGAEAESSTLGALRAPTDTTQFVEIAVRGGTFVNLYVRVAASTAAPVLQGPFE